MGKPVKIVRPRYSHYVVHSTYTIEEVLSHYGKVHNFDGVEVKVVSPRLRLYKDKGVVCVKCGREGSFFRLEHHEKQENDKNHFNLYGTDKESGEVFMMTKDHIIPKARGRQESSYQLPTYV